MRRSIINTLFYIWLYLLENSPARHLSKDVVIRRWRRRRWWSLRWRHCRIIWIWWWFLREKETRRFLIKKSVSKKMCKIRVLPNRKSGKERIWLYITDNVICITDNIMCTANNVISMIDGVTWITTDGVLSIIWWCNYE